MKCKECDRNKPLNQHGNCLSCQKEIDGYTYTRDKPEKRETIKDMDNQIKILIQYRHDVYSSMDYLLRFVKPFTKGRIND